MHGPTSSFHSSHDISNDGTPVTLVKGGHRWVFSCERGEEAPLLARLAELARQTDTPFDWFDAALVSHQLRKRLNAGLHRVDASPAGVAGEPLVQAGGKGAKSSAIPKD
jgi:hypothetical protein